MFNNKKKIVHKIFNIFNHYKESLEKILKCIARVNLELSIASFFLN